MLNSALPQNKTTETRTGSTVRAKTEIKGSLSIEDVSEVAFGTSSRIAQKHAWYHMGKGHEAAG